MSFSSKRKSKTIVKRSIFIIIIIMAARWLTWNGGHEIFVKDSLTRISCPPFHVSHWRFWCSKIQNSENILDKFNCFNFKVQIHKDWNIWLDKYTWKFYLWENCKFERQHRNKIVPLHKFNMKFILIWHHNYDKLSKSRVLSLPQLPTMMIQVVIVHVWGVCETMFCFVNIVFVTDVSFK